MKPVRLKVENIEEKEEELPKKISSNKEKSTLKPLFNKTFI